MHATTGPLPPLDEQRAILKGRIADFKREGFNTSLTRLALEVQVASTPPEEEKRRKQIADLQSGEENAYAAAARLQRMLDEIPAGDGG